jgi:Na+(H+)/acetate symporter ActP
MVTPGQAVWPAVLAVVGVCVATVAIGALGLRLSRTTSDFYVASRVVTPRWNASAIGGEYLSAASFLGIAGLVLAYGADVLWYPVGYTAGYLVLLALVAAPLRRSGAYTLPDFAQLRLGSLAVRRLSAVLVVGIGWLYLLPQFQGAGLALRTVTGAPQWVGALVVASVVVLNVAAGGMRSITLVQAFQYWLKLTAIAVPVFFVLLAWQADGSPDPAAPTPPVARTTSTLHVPDTVLVRVDAPLDATVHGVVDGRPVDGTLHLEPGTARIEAGTEVTLRAGSVVPQVLDVKASTGDQWATPTSGAGGRDHPLYRVYSLLLALLFGTMGLPHVLVRFYTNPDGRAARRTTLVVLALLGLFYVFPAVYGAMGRLYAPDLLLTGRTDAVVLLLPGRMLPAPWSNLISALVTAGAFAAFLSTSSGLTVSVAGVLSQDLLRGRLRTSVRGFRVGALLAVAVPGLLSLLTLRTSLADTVGLAFALAASTFCPLLVLGIWWRGLTTAGALAGLLTGGTLATVAVLATIMGGSSTGLAGALLAQPAAWTVPAAFVVMVAGSLLTRSSVPAAAGRVLARLHAPETLGLDRPTGQAATATDPAR